MTAIPPAMRPWEAEHVEVHASQSEPRLCGFHVLSRHRKTFCRDISCRVKFRRLDGEPHSSMTDAASKVPARHLTRPAVAFVVAGGCSIAALNWLSVTRSYLDTVEGSVLNDQPAALMWQMWAVLALCPLGSESSRISLATRGFVLTMISGEAASDGSRRVGPTRRSEKSSYARTLAGGQKTA